MTNGHTIPDLAKRGLTVPADPRLLRVKIVVVSIQFVVGLLCQLDGSFLAKLTGWPKDSIVLNVLMVEARTVTGATEPQFHFVVHHPDFPVVLAQPEMIVLQYQQKALEASNERNDSDSPPGSAGGARSEDGSGL